MFVCFEYYFGILYRYLQSINWNGFIFVFCDLSVESIVATVRHSLKRHYWLVNNWISHSKHLSEFVWAKCFRCGFRIRVCQCNFQEASLLFIRLNEEVKNRREWKRASHINCYKWVSLTYIKYTLVAQIRVPPRQ